MQHWGKLTPSNFLNLIYLTMAETTYNLVPLTSLSVVACLVIAAAVLPLIYSLLLRQKLKDER